MSTSSNTECGSPAPQHCEHAHDPTTPTSQKLAVVVTRRFQCQVSGCQAEVSTCEALIRHRQDVHGTKKNVCCIDDCTLAFARKEQLRSHMRLFHCVQVSSLSEAQSDDHRNESYLYGRRRKTSKLSHFHSESDSSIPKTPHSDDNSNVKEKSCESNNSTRSMDVHRITITTPNASSSQHQLQEPSQQQSLPFVSTIPLSMEIGTFATNKSIEHHDDNIVLEDVHSRLMNDSQGLSLTMSTQNVTLATLSQVADLFSNDFIPSPTSSCAQTSATRKQK